MTNSELILQQFLNRNRPVNTYLQYYQPSIPNKREIMVKHNGKMYRVKINKYGEIIERKEV